MAALYGAVAYRRRRNTLFLIVIGLAVHRTRDRCVTGHLGVSVRPLDVPLALACGVVIAEAIGLPCDVARIVGVGFRSREWEFDRALQRTPKEAEMGRIVVMNHLTLDGVMQGPGRPDEDTRDGFTHGGWGRPPGTPDDVAEGMSERVASAMSERMAAGGGLAGWLFGRRTYEDLLSTWNARGGPFKDALNNTPKYVASTTLTDPLPWPNSTLLHGDIDQAVGALKATSDGVLGIMGSGELIGSLMAADLIDEYLLMIHPLVLGTGRRLFPGHVRVSLRLIDGVTSAAGVVIASYEPARGQP